MEFVDEFEAKMKEISDKHDVKLADLYGKITSSIQKRNEYRAKADEALTNKSVDVSEVVQARTNAERCEKEAEVYQDLYKVAQEEILISPNEFVIYCRGIEEEYGEKQYYAYCKLLEALESVSGAIKEINMIGTEANTCYAALQHTATKTKNNIEYIGMPYADSLYFNHRNEEKLGISTVRASVLSKIENLAQYISKGGEE